MAGKSDMTLYGLRQLVEWSIDHSCMEDGLKKEVRQSWKAMWLVFCERIVGGEFTLKDDVGDGTGAGAGAGAGGVEAGVGVDVGVSRPLGG
jgi:adenosine deaminase CECR1